MLNFSSEREYFATEWQVIKLTNGWLTELLCGGRRCPYSRWVYYLFVNTPILHYFSHVRVFWGNLAVDEADENVRV